jgi:hypothetical protein
MTTRTAALQADLQIVANSWGLVPQTVVALPPSDGDPAAGQMRVYVNGVLVIRNYDETMEQP